MTELERLQGELEASRQRVKDAAMLLKIFITKKTDCTKHKEVVRDWLKRNGLEGSILRGRNDE